MSEKQRLFEACLSPSCTYTDPLIRANGWAELAQYMFQLEEQVPGAHFVTDYFFSHHQASIAKWRMLAADGQSLAEGISYGEYDERGRLARMVGYFEPARPRSA